MQIALFTTRYYCFVLDCTHCTGVRCTYIPMTSTAGLVIRDVFSHISIHPYAATMQSRPVYMCTIYTIHSTTVSSPRTASRTLWPVKLFLPTFVELVERVQEMGGQNDSLTGVLELPK